MRRSFCVIARQLSNDKRPHSSFAARAAQAVERPQGEWLLFPGREAVHRSAGSPRTALVNDITKQKARPKPSSGEVSQAVGPRQLIEHRRDAVEV